MLLIARLFPILPLLGTALPGGRFIQSFSIGHRVEPGDDIVVKPKGAD